MPRVIDLSREEPLSLYQAREHLPGHPAHPTIYRYCTVGIRGVKLETVRIGRKRYTSPSACQRFIDRLADVDEPAEV